MLLQLSSFCIG